MAVFEGRRRIHKSGEGETFRMNHLQKSKNRIYHSKEK
ncbi:hypothetical protein BSM4216_1664 [Bacillus smithii]|nr:hypothetical protein BSM4216_1664 [Bacillus smithii]